MKLAQFLETYAPAITDAVLRNYPPVYDADMRRACGFDLYRLLRRPLGAQGDAIRAAALSIQRQPGTVIVGEMGSGKSLIAAAAAYLAECSHRHRADRRRPGASPPGGWVGSVHHLLARVCQ